MTSIKLIVRGAAARAEVSGPLTSGMVGIPVTIEYDSAWDGLTKNLVCRSGQWYGPAGGETRTILNVGTTATVAHEVMTSEKRLYLGVEGYNADGTLVIPTTWADCGKIYPGANTDADPSADPSLPIWAQLQAEIKTLRENGVTDEQIEEAVESYLEKNPIDVPDSSENAGFAVQDTAPEDTSVLWVDPKDDTGNEGYVLPVGGDELGGVKNGGNVVINADGTMTAPEYDGSGINVSGAAVGQIVRIASVDESGTPTVWEAVDLPDGGDRWEQIAAVVATENINSIFVSFDACVAMKGYFVFGAVETDLGRIGIQLNTAEDANVMMSEMRHSVLEFTTGASVKRGTVSFEIDTRGTAVWQSNCATHYRNDGTYDTDIKDVLIPSNTEINASAVQHSLITTKYMYSKELEDGILSIRISGAGMVKGTKLFLWGMKK